MRKSGKIDESFSPKVLLMIKNFDCSVAWGLYSVLAILNYKKYMNWPLLHEGKFKKNKKCTKRSQTGSKR